MSLIIIWHSPRWMNRITITLILLMACIWLGVIVWRIIHSNQFNLQYVVIKSDNTTNLLHVHAADVYANLQGQFNGNFFTVGLNRIQQALQAVPWVRQISIRRVWPDTLLIKIEEHVPVAIWQNKEHDYLVNHYGEIFRVHSNDVYHWKKQQHRDKTLVFLEGPEGSSQEMLLRKIQIQKIFVSLGWRLTTLNLSQRYAWSAVFDNEIKIDFGREENKPSLEIRAKQFVQALPQIMQLQLARLVYADLRYPKGFAVRLHKDSNNEMKLRFLH